MIHWMVTRGEEYGVCRFAQVAMLDFEFNTKFIAI